MNLSLRFMFINLDLNAEGDGFQGFRDYVMDWMYLESLWFFGPPFLKETKTICHNQGLDSSQIVP